MTTGYAFKGGFPTPETIAKAYDDLDMNRAVQAYRFFYPTVSGAAVVKGWRDAGLLPNRIFGVLETQPRHVSFTPHPDAPYAQILVDLAGGPIVVELPPGPLVVSAVDVNQRWVADMGVPGPDEGKGGTHLFLPPGHRGAPPGGHHVWQATTRTLIVGGRSLPAGGDVKAALARIRTIKVYPLAPPPDWREPEWLELTEKPEDTTPLQWETNLQFWEALHQVIDTEPAVRQYRAYYGELAALGIAKGQPFAPDGRMKRILEAAAAIANAQLRVEAFACRRPDRIAWKDRRWEWAALRSENGDFDTPAHVDLEARDKWFYQAIGASPAMFRRTAGAGSLYWLGLRDATGAYLDGSKTYRLVLPQPVPAKLCWSVTVYDAETRSEIQTVQNRPALRSLVEMKDRMGDAVAMYFGPFPPLALERDWIQTIPGKGWFAYLRLYGPVSTAFDGSWKPGDFESSYKETRPVSGA